MKLIDRYVYAVIKRIPRKQREDIGKELKSLILDAVDEKTQGREPLQEEIIEVLKEFGQPSEVAQRYIPTPQYLISGSLFELYKLVTAIAFGAAILGIVISSIVEGVSNGSFLFFEMIARIVQAGIGAIGMTTIIFAVLDRYLPQKDKQAIMSNEEWSPQSLPAVPKNNTGFKYSDSIVGLIFTVVAIVVFNMFSDMIAIYYTEGDMLNVVPILNKGALAMYLPLWNILWGLSLIKEIILIYMGRWNWPMHIYDIILTVFSIVVLIMMITGPAIISSEAITSIPGIQDFGNITNIVQNAFRGALGLVIVLSVVGTLGKLYKHLKSVDTGEDM